MQLGRDAVEFKQFKQIEDGMERKINDRQNQDLIDQLALEKVNWVDIKIRYNDAKKLNKQTKDLFNNYNTAYALSGTLNKMIDDEDKMYKKAVYDRERALNKYLQEDIKEKNKFCFMMQQKTMQKTMKKNKSQMNPRRRVNNNNNRINQNIDKINANNINNDQNEKKNEEEIQKINEGSDDEEQNAIQNKLQNEKLLSQNQPIPA